MLFLLFFLISLVFMLYVCLGMDIAIENQEKLLKELAEIKELNKPVKKTTKKKAE